MFSRMDFSNRLSSLMKERGLSHQALADGIGVSRPAVTQLLSTRNQPSVENLVALADYFDVSLDYLIGRSNERMRR